MRQARFTLHCETAVRMGANQEKEVVGKFNAKCGRGIEFSRDRRVAWSKGYQDTFAFSNDQIPIGLQFSVKMLEKGSVFVSPINASSRPPTSDAPCSAGGAVHVASPLLLILCILWWRRRYIETVLE